MTRIKAAVAHAFGQPLSIEEVELAHPKPGEVEVTLDACAICHSDITYLDGGWGGSLPAVYGHEAAGRISALGDGVTRAKGWRCGRGNIDSLLWHLPLLLHRPADRL